MSSWWQDFQETLIKLEPPRLFVSMYPCLWRGRADLVWGSQTLKLCECTSSTHRLNRHLVAYWVSHRQCPRTIRSLHPSFSRTKSTRPSFLLKYITVSKCNLERTPSQVTFFTPQVGKSLVLPTPQKADTPKETTESYCWVTLSCYIISTANSSTLVFNRFTMLKIIFLIVPKIFPTNRWKSSLRIVVILQFARTLRTFALVASTFAYRLHADNFGLRVQLCNLLV